MHTKMIIIKDFKFRLIHENTNHLEVSKMGVETGDIVVWDGDEFLAHVTSGPIAAPFGHLGPIMELRRPGGDIVHRVPLEHRCKNWRVYRLELPENKEKQKNDGCCKHFSDEFDELCILPDGHEGLHRSFAKKEQRYVRKSS